METNMKYDNIEKSKFEFVQQNEKIFDKAHETKRVGYYKDAWRRFKKNKASVIALGIIVGLLLFSIIASIFAPFALDFEDDHYRNMLPKNIFADGTKQVTNGEYLYEQDLALSVGVNHFEATGKTLAECNALGIFSNITDGKNNKYSPIIGNVKESLLYDPDGIKMQFSYKYDVYKGVGFFWKTVPTAEYEQMKAWQQETGLPLIFPATNIATSATDLNGRAKDSANIWYKHDGKTLPNALNSSGKVRGIYEEFVPNYRIEGGVIVDWSQEGTTGNLKRVRLLTENWFRFTYGTEPGFIFGTDSGGRDIFVRLATAVQTSFLLGIAITAICFVIGSVIGAMMGYYGGWFDLGMGGFMDILGGIPGTVVFILLKLKLVVTGIVSGIGALLIYFLIFGWLGDAGAMRNQFYRFKHQEYVLAARTLGAKDRRIMFKHILPNSWGTIITGLALSIPGVVGLEATLAYLGILSIDGPNSASIGAMIAEGQEMFTLYPHVVFFPLLVLALIMISFNLFGNGLRDAFNPQLRGVEE